MYENEVKGTFFVLRLFSDPPIDNPIMVDARIVNEDILVSKDYTFSWLSSIKIAMKVTGYVQYWNDGNNCIHVMRRNIHITFKKCGTMKKKSQKFLCK